MESVPFLKYTLLRLGIFFVSFAVLYFLLQWNMIMALIVAMIIAFAVSYLFFNKLRLAANQQVVGRLSGKGPRNERVVDHDAEAEDAFQETLPDPYAEPQEDTKPSKDSRASE